MCARRRGGRGKGRGGGRRGEGKETSKKGKGDKRVENGEKGEEATKKGEERRGRRRREKSNMAGTTSSVIAQEATECRAYCYLYKGGGIGGRRALSLPTF